MKITLLFLFFAVATASQLDHEDQKDEKIDPIHNQETPTVDKFHQKRTLFRARPFYRKRHIGIHPLGFKYILGYGPVRYNYVFRKPQVTYLKPVLHTSGWKPIIPVKPVVPVKPAVVHTPVIHTPVLPAPSGEKPVILPSPQVPVVKPVLPGVIQYPTVLKPVLPQTPVVNPLVPLPGTLLPQIHPLLRPLLHQFMLNYQPGLLQHGNHLDVLGQVAQNVWPQVVAKPVLPLQPQPVLQHGNHLDVLQPTLGFPQGVVPHGHHLDVVEPAKPLLHFHPSAVQAEGVVHHGNHLDVVQPAKPFLHFHPQQVVPSAIQPEGVVHHGNHLDILKQLPQHLLPHGGHFDLLQPFKPLPLVPQPNLIQHGGHFDVQNPAHFDLESHVHPEEPNVLHTEAHLHQDQHHLIPHEHPVHPAPQLPLYLPQHPNYKPGVVSSSVQEEHSATFPRYPLLGKRND